MYRWLILVLCMHAKYGYLRIADWKTDVSSDKFVPMMMDEDDLGHGSHDHNGFRGNHPNPLQYFGYRTAQKYHANAFDKCDKYSPNYQPGHPDCNINRCDKSSINYMPNHPDCANKCDPHSIVFQPNHPDCTVCDPNSVNFQPNNPNCPIPQPCPVPDPCNSECENFDPCNEQCATFDPCNEQCPNFDPCNESCPSFDKCNEDCASFDKCDEDCPAFDKCDEDCLAFDDCDETCPSFDKCNEACPSFDECDEDCPSFDPCNSNCEVNNPTKCKEGCPDFDACDEECTDADKTDCPDPNRMMDPCDPDSDNFDPTLEQCALPPKCQVMLSSIDTTACQINEEFQAMTCGDCPDADIDIEELTDACRNPSNDLIDCMATIGSSEREDGQTCKMYEFKFTRSTMSPKCFKPKPKYHPYPQHEPRYIKRYVRQPHKLSSPKHYQAPKKLFYKPKKMVVIVRKRYI